ncbi:hypothetical protein F5880DRAFT_1550835 [Lentinula raphanica]|nr:hypothetical protein F5880DRAFT_1550835 [Lentinula raphanica]
MLLIPFDKLRAPLSWRRLPRIVLLAVCLLDTLVAARPMAVQELVPRDQSVTNSLRFQIYKPASGTAIKAIRLCLIFGTEIVICSRSSPSVTAWNSIRHTGAKIGDMTFFTNDYKKTIFQNLQQQNSESNPSDNPWILMNKSVQDLVFTFPTYIDQQLQPVCSVSPDAWENWQKMFLEGATTSLSVFFYKSTGDIEIRFDGEVAMTFFGESLESSSSHNVQPLPVFTIVAHYWNPAVFWEALQEIHQHALDSNELSDTEWFHGFQSVGSLPAQARPLAWVDKVWTFLSEKTTGWVKGDPEGIKAISYDQAAWKKAARTKVVKTVLPKVASKKKGRGGKGRH